MIHVLLMMHSILLMLHSDTCLSCLFFFSIAFKNRKSTNVLLQEINDVSESNRICPLCVVVPKRRVWIITHHKIAAIVTVTMLGINAVATQAAGSTLKCTEFGTIQAQRADAS